jgi:hypothetical protein
MNRKLQYFMKSITLLAVAAALIPGALGNGFARTHGLE